MSDVIDILRSIHGKKDGGFVLNSKPDNVIAVVSRDGVRKYINQSDSSDTKEMAVPNKSYKMEPAIPIFLERFIAVFSGESGEGKTSMASLLIGQYMRVFTKNPIYFISQAPFKDDPNLSKLPLIQLDTENIDEEDIDKFEDSLLVLDDNDFSDDVKKIMKILNKAVEIGRKKGISIIFITHINSKLNASPIYREFNMYTTFFSNLDNNRMLYNNLKIPKDIIEELKEYRPAFITFNKTYRSVITDSFIFKY